MEYRAVPGMLRVTDPCNIKNQQTISYNHAKIHFCQSIQNLTDSTDRRKVCITDMNAINHLNTRGL